MVHCEELPKEHLLVQGTEPTLREMQEDLDDEGVHLAKGQIWVGWGDSDPVFLGLGFRVRVTVGVGVEFSSRLPFDGIGNKRMVNRGVRIQHVVHVALDVVHRHHRLDDGGPRQSGTL